MVIFFQSIAMIVTLIIALLLSGCTPQLEPSIITVDNRTVELYSKRNGSETVIFESGLDGTMQWWSKVIPKMDNNLSLFAYNRAGYGKSTPVQSVRDGDHIVEELRSTLKNNAIEPPYILVGHSLGGLYMQYYARKYPDEIQALILVDSTHPNQLHGDGDPKNWPSITRFIFNTLVSDTAKKEFDALDETGKEVLLLPTNTSIPIIILSAQEPISDHSKLADDSNEKRIGLARLYPNAEQIWVDSGHAIPYEKPESVIEAIKSIHKRSLK